MSEMRSRLERITSHPIAGLVNLGGNLVVLGGAAVAAVVLVLGFLSDKTLAAVAFGVIVSFAVTIYLWWRVRTLSAMVGATQPTGGSVRNKTDDPAQKELLRAVSRSLTESFERFESDNLHGSIDAGDEARTALTAAVSASVEITDATARAAVLNYRDVFESIPPGYRNRDYGPRGATPPELEALRQASRDALTAIGNAIRGDQGSA